jgi:hypothetical protein
MQAAEGTAKSINRDESALEEIQRIAICMYVPKKMIFFVHPPLESC